MSETSWGNGSISFISLPLLRDHSLLSLGVQCLENTFSMYFVCRFVSSGWVNLVNPSCLEQKICFPVSYLVLPMSLLE